jgi:Fe-S cluster biogenesis protein NfuA
MKKKIPNSENAIWSKADAILAKARPYIQMHGGDVRLIEIKDGTASLKIDGACVDCQLADMTYNRILGTLLKEEIPEIKKVKII